MLLVAVAALAIAWALFDWNWLRSPLEHYLTRESKREVKIGDLHVALGLNPTLRLRDLQVQNAPWADSRPLITAGEASFTLSLRSLWDDLTVISLIVLTDADVNLERQADGLRNWRLIDPDYRGPPTVKVQALKAQRTKLRFVHRGIDLDLVTAASEPVPDASRPARLTTRIDFSGVYQKAKYSGSALTGERLTLRDSDESFPLLGHMQWNGTRLDVHGSIADLLELAAIDAKIRFAGPSLAGLRPFLRFQLPATRAYALEGQLTRSGSETSLAKLHGKIGATDIAGDISYTRKEPRPVWRAALRSNSADSADFMAAPAAPAAGTGRVFSDSKLDFQRLSASDARVTLEAKKLHAGGTMELENLRLTAALNEGVLQLKPLEFGVAGGRFAGVLTLDKTSTQAKFDFRQLSLARMFPETAAKTHASGLVDGRIELAGRGDSVAAILGNASGSLDAAMGRGRISNLADAKLALNAGRMIGLWLRGDRDIDILCAAASIDFRSGKGRSRVLTLDTEQTRTEGNGTVDLGAEKFDVLLSSTPKKPGLFALGADVHIEGSFRDARFSLSRNKAAVPAGAGPCAGR